MEVVVEKLVYGGYGLARYEGQVLLIPFAAPGDRLRVRPTQQKKSVTIAHIQELIEPSPWRTEPQCCYYQTCGGCQLQHLTYEAQRQAKLEFLNESLTRLGGIEWALEIPFIASPPFEYRMRTQLKLQRGSGDVRIGYFKPESHELCVIDRCPLLSPRLNQALEQLRSLSPEQFDNARAIDLVQGDENSVASFPDVGISESDNVSVLIDEFRFGELRFSVAARTFFQVNRFLFREMLDAVVATEQGDCVLDLYCGVGFFTIPLSRRFDAAIGVEGNPWTVRLAEHNARQNGVSHINFVMAQVEKWLENQRELQGRVDLVVVDPPRPGLTRNIIKSLVGIRPQRITYVACNPTTLARDLKHLLAAGYEMTSLVAIDLFPQTYHIETVAKLRWH